MKNIESLEYITDAHLALDLCKVKKLLTPPKIIGYFYTRSLHIDTNWSEPMIVIRFKDGSKLVELNGILTAFYN